MDRFTRRGCDLVQQRVRVLESSRHFRAAVAPLVVQVRWVSAPGSVAQDLRLLTCPEVKRRKWPINGAQPQPVAHNLHCTNPDERPA